MGRIDADPSRAVPAVPCWPSGHSSASASRGLPRPITGAHCSPAWLHSQLAGIAARLPCDLRRIGPPSFGGSVNQQQRAGTGTPSLASLTCVRLSFVRSAVHPGPVGAARQRGAFAPGWHRRRSSLTPEARAGAAPVGRMDHLLGHDLSSEAPALPQDHLATPQDA